MCALENPFSEVDFPAENGRATEFVDHTEISGFETSGLLTNEQLANYIRETIPPSHLEGCPSIEYASSDLYFLLHPDCLAYFDPQNHEIKVGPSERFVMYSEGKEGMIDTVTHEIGHNAHQNLIENRPEVAKGWEEIHLVSGENEFVSDYARTNVYEDFAETYNTYVRDPELLQFVSPQKYEFMRDVVFSGREYPPR